MPIVAIHEIAVVSEITIIIYRPSSETFRRIIHIGIYVSSRSSVGVGWDSSRGITP